MKKVLQHEFKVIEEAVKSIESKYIDCRNDLSTIDKLRNDILHEIEFNDITPKEKKAKYIELSKALKIRRALKVEVEMIQAFRTEINIKRVDKSIKRVESILKAGKTREYHNRVSASTRSRILLKG